MTLLPFIGRRLLRAAITVFLTVTFFFFLLRVGVDVGLVALKYEASPEAVAAFNARWGYDQSLWSQYLSYLNGLLHFDLGASFRDGRPAAEWITDRLGKTLKLSVTGFLLSILIGVPLGICAAMRKGGRLDQIIMGFAVTGYALPSFVLGLVLMYIFAVWLRLLPSSGSDDPQHLILPALTYALGGAAGLARFTRAAFLDVLSRPFIRAVRVAGLPQRQILISHALPNTAGPLLTVLGFSAGSLVGHAVVVETVFAWPGLGQGLIEAVTSRDLAVVQAMILLFACFMITANAAVDILTALIDPRLRRGRA